MIKLLKKTQNSTLCAHFNRAIKRYESIRFLYQNTFANWFAVITDDVMVNLKNVIKMLNEENNKGNPLIFDHWFGNCIDKPWRYFQGGSGYILSRSTAQKFIQPNIGIKWILNLEEAEDIYLTQALFYLGLNVKDGTSGSFLGHNLTRFDYKLLSKKEFNSFPICPIKIKNKYCKPGLWSLNDLVFLHQGNLLETIEIHNLIKNNKIPLNLYWYQGKNDPHLCLKK